MNPHLNSEELAGSTVLADQGKINRCQRLQYWLQLPNTEKGLKCLLLRETEHDQVLSRGILLYKNIPIWEFTRIEVSVWNIQFASVVKGRL